METLVIQGLSMLGAALILVAYALAARRGWEPSTRRSAAVNLAGACLLGGVAVVERQIGFILLEAVWAVVAIRRLLAPGAGEEAA